MVHITRISLACICIVVHRILHADQSVAVDKAVTVRCHASDSQPVLWEIRNFTETIAHMVYDGHLISGYEHRYIIDESTYDLTIRNSQLRDTGEYSCVEDEGFGTKHVTKLYVTGRLLYAVLVFHCSYFYRHCFDHRFDTVIVERMTVVMLVVGSVMYV